MLGQAVFVSRLLLFVSVRVLFGNLRRRLAQILGV